MGDKSVFPHFYFGTKSVIILQRNCKLIKRIKYLLSLNTCWGITLFLYIHEKNKRILTTRQVKITVSCDIHARQSCFVFLFYMVQFRNKIAMRRKIPMMTKHWFSWSETCEKKRLFWIMCFIFFCKLFRFKRNKLKVKAILFSSRQFIQWRIWVYNSLF